MGVLLPYQARWVADPARVRVAAKARRVGLSWAEAARQVLRAAKTKGQGGNNCYYVSTSARLGREYIAACAQWVRMLNVGGALVADERADILTGEIRFRSGHVIKALPSNPEAMRGLGGSIVIDEGAFHDDLEALLRAAYAVGDWGGDLAIISTYNGIDEPFYELVENIEAGKVRASLHRIDIRQALAEGLHKRRCQAQGRQWTPESEREWLEACLATPGAEEEYLCIPRRSGGTYIRRALIEECMIEGTVIRWELPPEHARRTESGRATAVQQWAHAHLSPLLARLPIGRPVALGYDFARSHNGDLSVLAPMAELQNLRKSTPWLVEMRGVGYEDQWTLLQWVVSHLQAHGQRRFAGLAIDSGGSGGYLGDKALARWGSSLVDAVQLSEAWYSKHMPPFRAAFEEHTIEVVNDADVRDDLLQIAKNPRGVPKLTDVRRKDATDGKPRHGDAAIALALAYSRFSKPTLTTHVESLRGR